MSENQPFDPLGYYLMIYHSYLLSYLRSNSADINDDKTMERIYSIGYLLSSRLAPILMKIDIVEKSGKTPVKLLVSTDMYSKIEPLMKIELIPKATIFGLPYEIDEKVPAEKQVMVIYK